MAIVRIYRQIEIMLILKMYKGGLGTKRKAWACSLSTEKRLILYLLARKLLIVSFIFA